MTAFVVEPASDGTDGGGREIVEGVWYAPTEPEVDNDVGIGGEDLGRFDGVWYAPTELDVDNDAGIGGAIGGEDLGRFDGVWYELVVDVGNNDGGMGGAEGIFNVFVGGNGVEGVPREKDKHEIWQSLYKLNWSE